MTTLLDDAIALARKLPIAEQDEAATSLFALLSGRDREDRLTPDQVEIDLDVRLDHAPGRSERLDEAISRLKHLPETEQDLAASAIFALIERDQQEGELTAAQADEVRSICDRLDSGQERLLSDREVGEMWRRLGA